MRIILFQIPPAEQGIVDERGDAEMGGAYQQGHRGEGCAEDVARQQRPLLEGIAGSQQPRRGYAATPPIAIPGPGSGP